jgi:hypothetical protein
VLDGLDDDQWQVWASRAQFLWRRSQEQTQAAVLGAIAKAFGR